jgi:hypothetical protein
MYNLTQRKRQGWPTQRAAMAAESGSDRKLSQWCHRNTQKSVTGVLQDVAVVQILPRRSRLQKCHTVFHGTRINELSFTQMRKVRPSLQEHIQRPGGGGGDVSPGSRQAEKWEEKQTTYMKIFIFFTQKILKYQTSFPLFVYSCFITN